MGAAVFVKVPDGTVEVRKYAFEFSCSLQEVELPESVTKIGEAAFRSCGALHTISMPSVASIDDLAFHTCHALKHLNIPESVARIGLQAFCACGALESIQIPSLVTNIADGTFHQCHKLKRVEISGSVASIGRKAFDSCGALESINLPRSLTSILEVLGSNSYFLLIIILRNSQNTSFFTRVLRHWGLGLQLLQCLEASGDP